MRMIHWLCLRRRLRSRRSGCRGRHCFIATWRVRIDASEIYETPTLRHLLGLRATLLVFRTALLGFGATPHAFPVALLVFSALLINWATPTIVCLWTSTRTRSLAWKLEWGQRQVNHHIGFLQLRVNFRNRLISPRQRRVSPRQHLTNRQLRLSRHYLHPSQMLCHNIIFSIRMALLARMSTHRPGRMARQSRLSRTVQTTSTQPSLPNSLNRFQPIHWLFMRIPGTPDLGGRRSGKWSGQSIPIERQS